VVLPVLVVVAGIKLYREGIALALRQCAGPAVTAVAAAPSELAGLLADASDPVVLLDVGLLSGPEDLTRLRDAYPRARVLALGLSGDSTEIVAWIEAGAEGYLTREQSVAELAVAIRSLLSNELTCSPQVAAELLRRVAAMSSERRRAAMGEVLSRRELEVVSLIERGLSNKEIAGQLFIALATVKNHVHNILYKLEVTARSEAVAYVRERRGGDLDEVRATLRSVR